MFRATRRPSLVVGRASVGQMKELGRPQIIVNVLSGRAREGLPLPATRHTSARCGGLRSRWQMLFKVSQNICIDVGAGALAFGDSMGAARINAHVKLLSQRDQFVNQQLEALE